MQLTDNRYKNRRLIVEDLAELSKEGFKKCKEAGWLCSIRVNDLHISDRITERKIPYETFRNIVEKVITNFDGDILNMCEDYMKDKESLGRIQAYGENSYMVGAYLKVFDEHKSVHLVLHTCYQERNSNNRKRKVSFTPFYTQELKEAA